MNLGEFDPTAISDDQIPAALAQLAAFQSQLAARLMVAPAPEAAAEEPDKMLTTEEAADLLRRSPKWIYRHRRNLPFARKLCDRSWVFSEQGLRRWLARQKG